MPENRLGECHARCEWARRRLNELQVAIREFLAKTPYEVAHEFAPRTGEYSITLKVPVVPRELSFMAGEVLHNLRSSLDHLVWQLILANGQSEPTFPLEAASPWRRVQFPIFLEERQFDKRRSANLWSVGEEAQAFIKRYQPFAPGQDGELSPLWLLHELSNIDKHRMPHVAVSHLTYFRWVSRPVERGTIGGTLQRINMQLGDPVGRTQSLTIALGFDPAPVFKPSEHPGTPELQLDIGFHEASGIGQGQSLIGTLSTIGSWVHEIIQAAESLPTLHDVADNRK